MLPAFRSQWTFASILILILSAAVSHFVISKYGLTLEKGLLAGLALGSVLILLLHRTLERQLKKQICAITSLAKDQGKETPQNTWMPSLPDKELDLLAKAVLQMRQTLKSQAVQMENEKKNLSVILDSMSEGVIVMDSDHQIILINGAARRIFSLNEEGILGKSLIEITRHTEIDKMASLSIQRKEMVSGDVELSHPEGKYLKVKAAQIDSQEALRCALMIEDVTELRRLENLRREFVANVSHELRTPLTSIHGFAETLLSGAQEDPEKREVFLKIIQEDSSRLNQLIDDLLEISKLESKEIALDRKPVKLTEPVQKVLIMLESKMTAKKIRLQNQIAPASSPVVWTDEDKLKQVLINLLDNAIKFNREGGGIVLKAELYKNSDLSSSPSPLPLEGGEGWGEGVKSPPHPSSKIPELLISVEDTGIGIPQEVISRIFERFFRVDKARSRDLGGTGLGLSIVKHIVEAHGGKVFCESRLNQGTKISFTLPTAAL